MIIGVGLFMVWIDGEMKNQVLFLSVIFLLSGIILTILKGNITFISFGVSLVDISAKYWPILLIFAGILLLYGKRSE